MYVTGLQFKNYRNLDDGIIKPEKNINIIYGNNAQGKTNILESLWLFCGGHSFRASKENEFIKFGESFAKINVKFFSSQREQEAEILYNGGKKEVIINGVKKHSSSSLIGKYTAVIFSPDDLTLIKRGPSARRRFIDSAVCREKIQNAVVLSKFNQTLNQRNALLKDIYKHPELKTTLEIWDENFCYFGAKVIVQRLEYIEKIIEYAEKFHRGISDNKEKLEIKYISNCSAKRNHSVEEVRVKLREALKRNIDDDCRTGFTNAGPQRDDIEFFINKKKAKMFASQGQQRSAVLSLKLAEAKALSEMTGENPVILLDDVLSELDKKRQSFLLNQISDYQVFITCCDFNEAQFTNTGKKFFVEEGKIS